MHGKERRASETSHSLKRLLLSEARTPGAVWDPGARGPQHCSHWQSLNMQQGPGRAPEQASHIHPLTATGLARGSCLTKAKNPQGVLRKGPSWLKYIANYLNYYGFKLISCLLSFANPKQNTPLAACSEKAPLCFSSLSYYRWFCH